jgi:DNA-binding PadR family transcriptional regulator
VSQESPVNQASPAARDTGGSGGQDTGLPKLDPVIHAQPRLRLTVALATLPDGDKVTFPRLQELAGMTAGNLATHLRKLEDAGYVEVTKAYRRRTPVTYLTLTRAGRRALEDYTAALQNLLAVPGLNGHNGSAGTELTTVGESRQTEPEQHPERPERPEPGMENPS